MLATLISQDGQVFVITVGRVWVTRHANAVALRWEVIGRKSNFFWSRLVFAIAMQGERWILRNDVIWYKPNIPPRPESDRLRLSHEHFFHFVKRPTAGRAKYYYNLRQVEPGATDVVTVCVSAGRNG